MKNKGADKTDGLLPCGSQTHEDRFSRVEAHILVYDFMIGVRYQSNDSSGGYGLVSRYQ